MAQLIKRGMIDQVPPLVPKAARIILDLSFSEPRLDSVLLKALREQNENQALKAISRVKFKELFNSGKILIKGQRAHPSSALAKGLTYVDILGY